MEACVVVGVTLWEMFTYGQRPYEDIRAVDMAIAIERGERLPRPTICTIDVYMLMIKCKMLCHLLNVSVLTERFSKSHAFIINAF